MFSDYWILSELVKVDIVVPTELFRVGLSIINPELNETIRTALYSNLLSLGSCLISFFLNELRNFGYFGKFVEIDFVGPTKFFWVFLTKYFPQIYLV